MAHAKPSDLADVDELLTRIRSVGSLKEKSFGCFYFKGKGVLHFHVQKGRRFAHVFDGEKWREVDLVVGLSKRQQASAFKMISECFWFLD
ncbi:MAG: hypothetical protein AAB250_10105 [Bdellovibrionota bacterium]